METEYLGIPLYYQTSAIISSIIFGSLTFSRFGRTNSFYRDVLSTWQLNINILTQKKNNKSRKPNKKVHTD